MKPNREPGIEHEPHLQNRAFESADEAPLGMNASSRPLDGSNESDVEHTVWDEPALSELAGGVPDTGLRYETWIQTKISEWSQSKAWLVTLAIGFFVAPIFGILGFVFTQISSGTYYTFTIFTLLISPFYDTLCKILLPLWIVERRPYYFTGWFQIFICLIISATLYAGVFAGLMATDLVMVPLPEWMVLSYFTTHIISAAIISIGLEKIWGRAVFRHQQPQLTDGATWFLIACAVHVLWALLAQGYQLLNNPEFFNTLRSAFQR